MRGIYKITNTENGKCYIGKSEDIAARLKYHISTLQGGYNRNKHMQSSFNQAAEGTFCIEILEELDENDDIDERERYYIELYQSYDREHGFNLTKGGDGGNSYVECMTEEERKKHWEKHIELRTGENNQIFGKHLYTDGVTQKYISDDEIAEYEANGWHKGACDYLKEKVSNAYKGEHNPFYGKHHSKDTIEKILKTKRERGVLERQSNSKVYHKDGKTKFVPIEEIEKYEEQGWIAGLDPETIKKISESKKAKPIHKRHTEEEIKKTSLHFVYDGMDFYGIENIIKYLRENGYPLIGRKTIRNLINNNSKKYPELNGKLTIIKEDK